MEKNKLAIFAACGAFPLLAINKAIKNNLNFIIIGFKNISEFYKLEKYKNIKLYKTQIGCLNHILKILKKEKVNSILLTGKIEKINLLKILKFDLTTLKLFLKLKDYSDASLLQGIVDFFQKNKIECLSQKNFFYDLIVNKGCITKKKISKKDIASLKWGFIKAKEVALLGIGQSIITGNKIVISVEGIEGTDKMISRSKPLLLKENYFIKVVKKGHSLKYDLPAFGLNTIKSLRNLQINKIGLEAGMVMVPEMGKVLDFANKNHMCIYGL